MASARVMALGQVASVTASTTLRVANRMGAVRPKPCSAPLSGRPSLSSSSRSGRLVVRAEDLDFDAVLATIADKFEQAENKPVVIGYSVAAVAAVFFAEYIIHLPLFNVLLGFPIQLLGLAMVPVLGVRYVIEEKDAGKDAKEAVEKVIAQLPGLGK